jgi:hypothetical protein
MERTNRGWIVVNPSRFAKELGEFNNRALDAFAKHWL